MNVIKLFIPVLLSLPLMSRARIQWRDTSTKSEDLSWNNYSTTYIEPGDPHTPILVTAIPYNGKYEIDNTPLDMSFTGSLYRYQSTLSRKAQQLFTYDSSNVYFLAPGIHEGNAAQYEFRVTLDGTTELTPWQRVTAFTADDFSLNAFKKNMGWLGGYKTTWGHYLVASLRKKGDTANLSDVAVYWKPVKPSLQTVYTARTFMDFVANSKLLSGSMAKIPPLPDKLVLDNKESNVIFEVQGNIYKREALEYQLLRNEEVYRGWAANDGDHSFIWFKELPWGKYVLSMRFSGQRHNVTTYAFEVKPAWYQTGRFRLIAGLVAAILIGSIVLLIQVLRQRRKITREQLKKAKLQLSLQSVYAQLNPHFVFNALHSIQGLINKNDIAGANRYLGVFGNLMRDSLANNHKDMVALSQELSTLDTYLKLEQLRFGFRYEISVDPNINSYETEIPSLFLQPLVENAVKHGVGVLQEKGVVHLRITRNNNDMEVHIADNGHGFDATAATSGHGLRLTRERITLLNEMQPGQPIDLSIDSAPGKGATIAVSFKNWLT